MEEIVDIVICDPIDFDEGIFDSWLSGSKPETVLDARTNRKQTSPFFPRKEDDVVDSSSRLDPQAVDLLRYEVFDQYRNYEILEHYIKFPYLLAEQAMLQLSPESQTYIIQKYYDIEDFVGREVIGSFISSFSAIC